MAATVKPVRWISPDEMDNIIDKRARAILNMSGKEFVRKREKGHFSSLDADACPGIIELALLAPAVKKRRKVAGKNSKRSR